MTKELNALFNSKFNVETTGAITIIRMNGQIPILIIMSDQLESVKDSIVYISKDDWAKYVYIYTVEHAQNINDAANNQKSIYSLLKNMKSSNMRHNRIIADLLIDVAECGEINIADIILLVLAKDCKNSDELTSSVLALLQHITNSPGIDDKIKFIQTLHESLGAALTLNSEKSADEVKQKEVQDEIDESEPKAPDAGEMNDEMDDEINDSFNMVDKLLIHKDIAVKDSVSKTVILEMIRINSAMFLTNGNLDLNKYPKSSVNKIKLSDDDIDILYNAVDSYTVLNSKVFVEITGPDAEIKRISPVLRDIILSIDATLSELGITIKNVNKHRITRFEYVVNSADSSEKVLLTFII